MLTFNRDPVNLFASKFFFSRYSCNGCNERNHAKEVESIEKCIENEEPECVGTHVHQGNLKKNVPFENGV